MSQQLKEPETSTPLADYVYQKLGKGAPSRRSIIKYGLAGLLIGGGILSENIRHAYGSHGSPTDILDDAITTESISLEQFVEVENIPEASVVAPSAGRVKIFRSSADDLLKGKNPDDSIFIIEPSAFGAFLNVAQNWTEPQTYVLSSTTDPNAFTIQDDDSGFDTLIFGTSGSITIRHTSLGAETANVLNTVVASNDLITALEIKSNTSGGFDAHTMLVISPNTPDGDTPDSFIALLGAFDSNTPTNLEFLRINANNPANPADREYTLGAQIDGSGVLRPFIIVVGSDEMIEFRASLTMDFKSRNCINLGASGNDFGATNNLVATTFSADITMSSADIDMVTNRLMSGANPIITFASTTMNFNSRAVSNLLLGNAMVTNNNNIRLGTGQLLLGAGDDANLKRGAGGVLETDGPFLCDSTFEVGGTTVPSLVIRPIDALNLTSKVWEIKVSGEGNPRFDLLKNGQVEWGVGGASTVDVTLGRNGANRLFTEDAFFLNNITTPSTLANASGIFAQDVSSSSELFAFDEAGNATQLSMHNFTKFEPDLALAYPFSFFAKNKFLGVEIGVNLAQAMKDLGGLTGKNYMFESTFIPDNWGENQIRIKTEEDERSRQITESKEYDRREPLILAEMEKDIEVTKEEAVESQEIEEREFLTTPIYDDKTGEVIGEEPIMVETGNFILNERTGELEPEIVQDSIVVRTRISHTLKDGYSIDTRLRKFMRNKTRTEAEASVPSLPITFTRYRVKSPPLWLSQRGVN